MLTFRPGPWSLGSSLDRQHSPTYANKKKREASGRTGGSRRGPGKRARRMTSRSSLISMGQERGLKDLSTGLDACIEIVTLGRDNKSSWKLRRWATALVRYVSGVGQGKTDNALRAAKSYFARCRSFAINREEDWGESPRVPKIPGFTRAIDRRKLLHQISRVSRSLREASNEVVQESLRGHKEISLTPFETPEYLRRRFQKYLRHRFGGDAQAKAGTVGPSASFLLGKHEGGAVSEIREITDNFRARLLSLREIKELTSGLPTFISSLHRKLVNWDYVYHVTRSSEGARRYGLLPTFRLDCALFPYDKETELSLEDWEVTRETLFSLTACWLEIDMNELPRCRQVAVRERGFKVRVATPIEAPVRYILSMINSCLLSKLEELPQCVSALHGCPAEKLDWSLGVRKNLVFSADLKSATDYFPQDLMESAVDVIAENWPQELRQLFRRSVGNHLMTSPTGDEEWTSKRGILMGSPVSWPLLSMYSSWLHSESGSDGWYAVCGDDYIGCHTYQTYRKYLTARELTGAVGSPGKDILGRESVGVFAEELVTVGRCRWVPTVSVRAVLADPKSGLPAWQQGPEVSSALQRMNLSVRDTHRICERLHGRTLQQLRRAKVDPYAPRWCGGAGFPGIPHQGSLKAARILVSQSHDFVIEWITKLMGAWMTTGNSGLLVEHVSADLARHAELSQWESGTPGEWGPLADVVSSRLGSLSWAYVLAGAARHQLRVTLRSVSETSRKFGKAVASRGFWVPNEPIVSGEGIADRLNALEPMIRPPAFVPFLPKLVFRGSSRREDRFLAQKQSSGPWSPEWGPRKRRKLNTNNFSLAH